VFGQRVKWKICLGKSPPSCLYLSQRTPRQLRRGRARSRWAGRASAGRQEFALRPSPGRVSHDAPPAPQSPYFSIPSARGRAPSASKGEDAVSPPHRSGTPPHTPPRAGTPPADFAGDDGGGQDEGMEVGCLEQPACSDLGRMQQQLLLYGTSGSRAWTRRIQLLRTSQTCHPANRYASARTRRHTQSVRLQRLRLAWGSGSAATAGLRQLRRRTRSTRQRSRQAAARVQVGAINSIVRGIDVPC
jgi:hypothetical protein